MCRQSLKIISIIDAIESEFGRKFQKYNKERINKIRNCVRLVGRQVDLYVSNFSDNFPVYTNKEMTEKQNDLTKEIDTDDLNDEKKQGQKEAKTSKFESIGRTVKNQEEEDKINIKIEPFPILSILDKKDGETAWENFGKILELFEEHFQVEKYDQAEVELMRKMEEMEEKENQKNFVTDLNQVSEKSTSEDDYRYDMYKSVVRRPSIRETLCNANRKSFIGKRSPRPAEIDDALEKYNAEGVEKVKTKYLLGEIENSIRTFILAYQMDDMFRESNFNEFLNDDKNNFTNSRRKPQKFSIVKSFFEEFGAELQASKKKRHSLAPEELKNRLEELNKTGNRQCISNKNEDEFLMRQRAIARKRSNISEFSDNNLGGIGFDSGSDSNSEDDYDPMDFLKGNNAQGNINSSLGVGKRASTSTAESTTPKIRLSKRNSILLKCRKSLIHDVGHLNIVKEGEEENDHHSNSEKDDKSLDSIKSPEKRSKECRELYDSGYESPEPSSSKKSKNDSIYDSPEPSNSKKEKNDSIYDSPEPSSSKKSKFRI